MPFLVLVFNAVAVRKLAARGLTPQDVKAIFLYAPVVTVPNPNPRATDSLYAIGPTPEGRFVTVVVDPDPDDDARWHVRTAWEATAAQVSVFRSRHPKGIM